MTGSTRGDTPATVLEVFGERDDSSEPLTTIEVADRLDCSYRQAYDELTELAGRDVIRSKRIGPRARAWWRSGPGPSTIPDRLDDGRLTSSSAHVDRAVLERILETAPVSIVIVEATGEITFANARAAVMLGLERAEIVGRTYRESEWRIYREDGTPISVAEHPVTRVLETGRSVFGFEHWIERPDGSERWLSSNSSPVFDADGSVGAVIVGFEDATSLKNREDKLTSDRLRWVELRSERLFEPYLAVADGPVRLDVEEVVGLPDETTLSYLRAEGIPAKSLIDALEGEPGVIAVRLLSTTAEGSHVEVHRVSDTLPELFADFGGRVVSLLREETDEPPVLTGEIPGDVDIKELVLAARRIHPDVDVVSQSLRYTPRLLYDIVEDSLTDRQSAALQVAYFGGYFARPRRSTGEELAAQLGITRQTFNRHLRKAEETVFERLFEASGKAAR